MGYTYWEHTNGTYNFVHTVIYLVLTYGTYVWYIHIVHIFGTYVWYIYLVHMYGTYIWFTVHMIGKCTI